MAGISMHEAHINVIVTLVISCELLIMFICFVLQVKVFFNSVTLQQEHGKKKGNYFAGLFLKCVSAMVLLGYAVFRLVP